MIRRRPCKRGSMDRYAPLRPADVLAPGYQLSLVSPVSGVFRERLNPAPYPHALPSLTGQPITRSPGRQGSDKSALDLAISPDDRPSDQVRGSVMGDTFALEQKRP